MDTNMWRKLRFLWIFCLYVFRVVKSENVLESLVIRCEENCVPW